MFVKVCREEEAKVADQDLQEEFRDELAHQLRTRREADMSKKDALTNWMTDLGRKVQIREQNAGTSLPQLKVNLLLIKNLK